MLDDDRRIFEHYSSGLDMWREYAQNYGLITARVLCHHYSISD